MGFGAFAGGAANSALKTYSMIKGFQNEEEDREMRRKRLAMEQAEADRKQAEFERANELRNERRSLYDKHFTTEEAIPKVETPTTMPAQADKDTQAALSVGGLDQMMGAQPAADPIAQFKSGFSGAQPAPQPVVKSAQPETVPSGPVPTQGTRRVPRTDLTPASQLEYIRDSMNLESKYGEIQPQTLLAAQKLQNDMRKEGYSEALQALHGGDPQRALEMWNAMGERRGAKLIESKPALFTTPDGLKIQTHEAVFELPDGRKMTINAARELYGAMSFDKAMTVAATMKKSEDSLTTKEFAALLAVAGKGPQAGTGTGSKSGGKSGAGGAMSINDFTKLYSPGGDGGEAPAWAGDAYTTYQMLRDNNPRLNASASGDALAARLGSAVAQGKLQRLPEMDANGVWMDGVKDENGNFFAIRTDVDASKYIRKDAGGKEVGPITADYIAKQETGFLQKVAEGNPERFTKVASIAVDDARWNALLSAEKKARENNDHQKAAELSKSIRLAELVRKHRDDKPTAQPDKRSTEKPQPKPVMKEDLERAAKFGATPSSFTSLADGVRGAYGKVVEKASDMIESVANYDDKTAIAILRQGMKDKHHNRQNAMRLADTIREKPSLKSQLGQDELSVLRTLTGATDI